MNIKLEPVIKINTSDVLYDVKMKQFCIYPKIDKHNYDVEYIKKNCLKLSITSNN